MLMNDLSRFYFAPMMTWFMALFVVVGAQTVHQVPRPRETDCLREERYFVCNTSLKMHAE